MQRTTMRTIAEIESELEKAVRDIRYSYEIGAVDPEDLGPMYHLEDQLKEELLEALIAV